MPADAPGLKAVLSYYSSTVTLNAEGDTQLSGETVESLGTPPMFLSLLFGSLIKITTPDGRQTKTATAPDPNHNRQSSQSSAMPDTSQPRDSSPPRDTKHLKATERSEDSDHSEPDFSEDIDVSKKVKDLSLTMILPDPGYFAAGGLAGVISRTATAPLDRLKVYLIANTGEIKDSINAVKKGDAVAAAKTVGRPLIEASKALWKAGGMRSLFAGICFILHS
jgi:solute carrier family 25 phosphate transporter 23/24/25/41